MGASGGPPTHLAIPRTCLSSGLGFSSAPTSRAPFCENEIFGEANVSIESLHAHNSTVSCRTKVVFYMYSIKQLLRKQTVDAKA